LTTKYASTKLASTSGASKFTNRKITPVRIKDEIRFIYTEKQQLNKELLILHLKIINIWGKTWGYIERKRNEKLSIKNEKNFKQEIRQT
jgi:hypothetical protein